MSYDLDLETIKVKEFATILATYFQENNLYGNRKITKAELFEKIMGIRPKTAGRMKDWTFQRLFSQARSYLSRMKPVPLYIQGKRIPKLSSSATSTQIVGKVGYSISKKASDFMKNNEILDILKSMIEKGIINNKNLAIALKEQKSLLNFFKGKKI